MTGHIFLEGEVGEKVTLESVRADMASYPGATEWEIHIDSPGGDVDTGYAIGSILNNLKNTTANIGALCASIATYCAHCCDKIVMGPAGDFMIHLPTGTVNGTATDLRKGAERLDRIKSELTARYMKRVAKKGVTHEMVSGMLDEETSMSPDEALAMGFVDEVREKLKAVAKFNPKYNNDMTNEQKGVLEALGAKIDALFNALKPKNMVEVTLADGSIVQSSAATPEEIVGSTLTDEAGAPLPAGEVTTADGLVLVLAEGGVVQSAEPKMEDKEDDVQAKIKALEQENAALKQQLADTQKAEAETKVQAKELSEFKNQVKELKNTLEQIKNETFGDKEVPQDAPDKTQGKEVDPMIERMKQAYFDAYKSSR